MLTNIIKTNKLDLINYLIIFYSFSLSFPGELKRIITLLLLIFIIIDRNKPKVIYTKHVKAIFTSFIVFILYSLSTFFWTEATLFDCLDYIRKYWYLLIIYPIFIYLKKENISLVLSFFLLGIFVSEIFSYGNYFGMWEIGKGNIENPTVFMYHTFYSIFLAFTSIVLLIKILIENQFKLKLIYIIFFISVTLNLLLNVGRTGQITLILTIIVLIALYFNFKFKYIIYTFLSLIMVFILNYNFNSIFNKRINYIKSDITQIIHENNYTTSIGGRIGFWILSKEIISDDLVSFIGGVGPKQNIIIAKKIVDNKYPELSYTKELHHFHSTYLSILTQLGIIGLMIFLFIILSILKLKIYTKEIHLIKISLILIFMISSLVEVPFYKDVTLSLFGLFIGIILTQNKLETMNN